MSYTKIQMYRAANRWAVTLGSLSFLLSRSLSKTKPSIALSRFQNVYLSAFPCPGPRLLAPLRPRCPACPSRPRAPGRGEGAPVRSPAPGGFPLRTAGAAGSSPCARGLRFPSRAGRMPGAGRPLAWRAWGATGGGCSPQLPSLCLPAPFFSP